jgi:hypothetical protein
MNEAVFVSGLCGVGIALLFITFTGCCTRLASRRRTCSTF